SKVQESTKAPDEAKIKIGTEVFTGKIPSNLYEDELVPLFEKAGPIWDLHLLIDPLSSQNRGYAFITFCGKEAVKLCDSYEIRPGKHLGVCSSVANDRLFIGSIPKNKTKNFLKEFSKVIGLTEGLKDVILYHQPHDKKNLEFCFLEYENQKSAAQARCQLMSGKVEVCRNVVTVEWADPMEGPDTEVMVKVKVLFVRNLATTVTEEILEKSFSEFEKLERVKKLKDYAFVYFKDRGAAVKAMDEIKGKEIEGGINSLTQATREEKETMQPARQASRSTAYEDYYYHPPPSMTPPIRGQGHAGGRGGYGYPPDYYSYEDYYDDYYGYDYRGGYEDSYYGYDHGYTVRRRGGGRGGPPPPRGQGASPAPSRAGYSQRGAPLEPPRVSRGGRGGPAQWQRGRDSCGSQSNWGYVGGKRKADGYNQPDSQASSDQQPTEGSQPISRQPLQQSGDYSGNCGYNFIDTYGQQWK
uniref:RRM domain-containing protein n=1 Tax=Otolemur garnettii TaxID=30611 RepID=H0XUF6_OTOGA